MIGRICSHFFVAIFFNQIKYHGWFSFFSVYHNVQNRTLISLDMLPPISENGPKHPPSCLRQKPRSHPDSSLSLHQQVLASPPPEQMLNPCTFHYYYHLSNTSHHVCGSVKEVFKRGQWEAITFVYSTAKCLAIGLRLWLIRRTPTVSWT